MVVEHKEFTLDHGVVKILDRRSIEGLKDSIQHGFFAGILNAISPYLEGGCLSKQDRWVFHIPSLVVDDTQFIFGDYCTKAPSYRLAKTFEGDVFVQCGVDGNWGLSFNSNSTVEIPIRCFDTLDYLVFLGVGTEKDEIYMCIERNRIPECVY